MPVTGITVEHARIFGLMATVFEPVTSDQARRVNELEAVLRSLASGRTVLVDRATHYVMTNAEADRLYWVIEDPGCRAQDIEVEQVHGGHESIFDAIDACMAKQKARRGTTEASRR